MSTATTPIERSRLDIRGALFYVLLLISIGLALLTLGVLVGDVLKDGAGWVTTTLLFDPPSVDPNIAGARPAILATIYLGILVLLFTVPLGVATALYLEEYAQRTAGTTASSRSTSRTSPACLRSSMASSGSRSSFAGSAWAGCCSPAPSSSRS